MKHWVVPALVTLVAGCAALESGEQVEYYDYDAQPEQELSHWDVPNHALNEMVKGLARDLVSSNEYATHETPVAVTSFVKLGTLEETNWLGNQLSESFMHELHSHGLTVVDFKTTGSIRVTQDGDFALSRDWEELSGSQIIDYVVTGTMTHQNDGIIVNARMIGMQSHVVVATSQAFIPSWVYEDRLEEIQNVHMKDGMIIREASEIKADKRAVSIRQ